MAEEVPRDEGSREEALAKLEGMNDPLRVAIFTALLRKPASVAELAERLDVPIGRVRYQLGRLREAGLAELREQRPRRGVVEQVYFSRPAVISIEDAAQLDLEELNEGHVEILKVMVRDCLAAFRAGRFASREEFMMARIPLQLDEEGWTLTADLQHETLDRLLQINADALARSEASGAESISAFAFLLLFEAAPYSA